MARPDFLPLRRAALHRNWLWGSWLSGAAALAFAAVLIASRPATTLAQGTPSEIRIGGTISLSGPFQAGVGVFQKLAEAWADRINAKGGIFLKQYGKSLPVKFIYYDDKSEATTALSLYERLATVDKVDLFIGPFSSGLNNAAVQAALTHKIPYFVPEGNDAVIYATPNPWRATGLAPAESEYNRLVELYAKLGGLKSIAILARDNLHEVASAKAFGDHLKKLGIAVVYEDIAPTATKDFASIILKMKEAKPDAVMVESLPPPFSIQFIKQAREQGLNPKEFILGHTYAAVIKALGESAENITGVLYFFDGDTPDHKEFQEICKAAGFEPWQFSESGIRYRTYRRIQDALTRAGSLDHEAVRAAMYSADFMLFGEEHMKVDARGYGTDVPYPAQVQGGKLVSLWPLDKAVKMHKFKDGKW
jgi:ABC-type branched-subunit amino acid transport system substrate-binding protein